MVTLKRNPKCISVFKAEQYDDGFPPSGLLAFQAWLNGVCESIPVDHRGSTTINIDTRASYGDSYYATIEIAYTRLETDAELEDRRIKMVAVEDGMKNRERAQYEALKAKYG